MTVWVLHQVLTAQEEAEIETRTSLILPFDDLPDLSKMNSPQACRLLLQTLHPDLPPESVMRQAERLWKQFSELHMEDIIAVPLTASKEVALAHVSGPYHYEVGENGHDIHQIPVEWYKKRLTPRQTAKYAEAFLVGSGGMTEIENQEARRLILGRLPHNYNRFVKWQWILGLFFVLRLIQYGIGMLEKH